MSKPSRYNPEYHDNWAWSLAIKGATDEEIADAFDMSRQTIARWKAKYPSFNEALNNGKDIADSNVEKSLYKRAVGFTYEEYERSKEVDKNGEVKTVKNKTVTKTVIPDTMAIMYWLNNRKRGTWAQKQEVQLSASEEGDTNIIISLPSNGRRRFVDEGPDEAEQEE